MRLPTRIGSSTNEKHSNPIVPWCQWFFGNLVSVLQTNTRSPDVFCQKRWPKRQDYLELCHKSLIPPIEGQTEV